MPAAAHSRRLDAACGLLAGLPALAWSWYHAAPGLTFHDSGEFGLAAMSFGVPHPPGAPTWVLLAGVFTRVGGFADPVRGTNLFSGLCAAVTLGLLAVLVRRWLMMDRAGAEPRTACVGGLVAAASLAALPAFLDQALITEQYTLLTALLVGVLLAATAVLPTANVHPAGLRFAVLGLLWGLACGNHVSQLALGTIVAWALVVGAGRDRRLLLRRSLLVGGGFLAGALVFVWLVLRSRAEPLLDWGDVETPSRLWWALTRQDWATRAPTAAPTGFGRAWLASMVPAGMAAQVVLAAGLGGMIAMARTARRRLAWLLLAAVPYSVGIYVAHLGQDGIGLDYIRHYGVGDWHLPLYVIAAVALGWLAGSLPMGRFPGPRILGPTVILVLVLGAGEFARRPASRRNDTGPRNFATALLAPLPAGALVAVSDPDPAFMMGYTRYALGERPDLAVAYTRPGVGAVLAATVARGGPWTPAAQEQFLVDQWRDPRRQPLRHPLPTGTPVERAPLVTLYPRSLPETATRLLPAGLLFVVTAVPVDSAAVRAAEIAWRTGFAGQLPDPDPGARLPRRAAWSRLHLMRAEYFTAHALWDLAAAEAERAVAWLPDLAVGWYNLGFVRMQSGQAAEAEIALERALVEDAEVAGVRTALARLALGRGDRHRAEALLKDELSRWPTDAQARALLDYLCRAP